MDEMELYIKNLEREKELRAKLDKSVICKTIEDKKGEDAGLDGETKEVLGGISDALEEIEWYFVLGKLYEKRHPQEAAKAIAEIEEICEKLGNKTWSELDEQAKKKLIKEYPDITAIVENPTGILKA